MIAPLFYAWERRLHSRTPDRVVRPFEWGLEWVTTNGHAPDDAPDVVLADSPAFF
jgi:hypothetical protein